MTFRLAACAEMLYLELPFVERVRRISKLGYEVEMWNWQTKDLESLAKTGAIFGSMTGYLSGDLITDDGAKQLLATAKLSIEASEVIGCPRLNLHGTGLNEHGLPIKPIERVSGRDWLKARDTLARIADLGERHNKIFMLENLNLLVDHPGTPFGLAADTLALVEAIDHPNLRLNLDLYHAQIGEGNLIELVRTAFDYIGEIQVADVPGRFEPGTGEVNWSAIAAALRDLDYHGVVGLEGWAKADSDAALAAFAQAFA